MGNPALLLLGLVPLALAFGSTKQAKAKTQPPPQEPKEPPKQIPAELNAAVTKALNARDTELLRALAAQLRDLGFEKTAGVVEAKAQEFDLRKDRAPTAPDLLPEPLLSEFEAARTSGDMRLLTDTAEKLDQAGYSAAAETLRQLARQAAMSPQRGAPQGGVQRSAQKQEPVYVSQPAPGPQPVPFETTPPTTADVVRSPGQPQPPAYQEQPAGMPDALRSQFEQALHSTSVQALTSVAFVLEKAGYAAEAEQLRARARELAPQKPSPPAAQPGAALDPNMPPSLQEQVARQLAMQGNPETLERLGAALQEQGFPNSANALRAKAALIRASVDAGDTLGRIDEVLKGKPVDTKAPGPGEPNVTIQPVPPKAPPVQSAPPVKAAPPQPWPPVTVMPPALPPPQPAKPDPIVAQSLELATHLHSTRRYKEDRKKVTAWQLAVDVQPPDGLYGPSSALKMAEYVDDPPPVYYWPKKNSLQKKREFAAAMSALAKQEQDRNPTKAANLRRVAASALEGNT